VATEPLAVPKRKNRSGLLPNSSSNGLHMQVSASVSLPLASRPQQQQQQQQQVPAATLAPAQAPVARFQPLLLPQAAAAAAANLATSQRLWAQAVLFRVVARCHGNSGLTSSSNSSRRALAAVPAAASRLRFTNGVPLWESSHMLRLYLHPVPTRCCRRSAGVLRSRRRRRRRAI
jgi:hypothetical protein